ncbi:MAG: right-handed parallel beta-helix repeat-containing protein [Arenimonas sp.]
MKPARSAFAASVSLLLSCLFAIAALVPRPAAAETLTCTEITVLPATIAAAGHYCLHQNFSAAFAVPAIQVNANNVVLDCNDHYINNSSPGVTGIYVSNRQQVTVRNCGLTNFGRGIAYFETTAGGSRNHLVSGNRVLKSRLTGIQMAGSANIIENNRVSDNFGGSATYTYGILVSSFDGNGVANVVRNNVVTQIAPALYVRILGIYLIDVDNNAVINNTVSGLFPPLDMTAAGIGAAPSVLGTAAVGNTVLAVTGNPPGGGSGSINYGGGSIDGIRFDADPDANNRNACRANVVGHWQSNILVEGATNGCVKDGNTEF